MTPAQYKAAAIALREYFAILSALPREFAPDMEYFFKLAELRDALEKEGMK